MGIDLHVLQFLTHVRHSTDEPFGRTLTLGHQGFHISNTHGRALASEMLGIDIDNVQPPGEIWADALFEYLGSSSITALDASGFEGAAIIHDLNLPVPQSLHGEFDTIFDGGTLEHIFDIPAALSNVKSMLKIGGRFISVNAANNQLGHGLYQFSPDLIYSVFSEVNGFQIESTCLSQLEQPPRLLDVANPVTLRRRVEIGTTSGPTYLLVSAKKIANTNQLRVQQSDYLHAWASANSLQVVNSADSGSEAEVPLNGSSSVTSSFYQEPMKRAEVVSLCNELNSRLNEQLQSSASQNHFITKFLRHINVDEAFVVHFVQSLTRRFLKEISTKQLGLMSSRSVPFITHKIWVTSRSAPHLPAAGYVSDTVRSLSSYPREFTHYFWTNSATVESHMRRAFVDAGIVNVVVENTRLFAGDPLSSRIDRLISDGKYVLAADMLKVVVLCRFGGIYSDLGVSFDKSLLHLISLSEYAMIYGGSGFFQLSFLASHTGSDLLKIFKALLSHPEAYGSQYALLKPEPTALDEVNLFSGIGLTICTFLFMSSTSNVLVLPSQSKHLTWRSEKSWYGTEGKYGNVIVAESRPTLLLEAAFSQMEEVRDKAVQVWGGQTKLIEEKLKILSALSGYFRSHPTEFCRTFYFWGSDKALGWHNYAYVYNYIVGQHSDRIRCTVEIGIGSNNADVPSNMGPSGIPGASLRGWRDLLDRSLIIGGDLDRRILFSEDRITTYFVDQLQPETLSTFFTNIGLSVDLMIDDGLHTFEANRGVMEAALKVMSPAGLLVIEDVPAEDVGKWHNLLNKAHHHCALVTLPHTSHATDNRILLVFGLLWDDRDHA